MLAHIIYESQPPRWVGWGGGMCVHVRTATTTTTLQMNKPLRWHFHTAHGQALQLAKPALTESFWQPRSRPATMTRWMSSADDSSTSQPISRQCGHVLRADRRERDPLSRFVTQSEHTHLRTCRSAYTSNRIACCTHRQRHTHKYRHKHTHTAHT